MVTSPAQRLEAANQRVQGIYKRYQEIEAGTAAAMPGELKAFPVFVQACARAVEAQLDVTAAMLLERAIRDYNTALERAKEKA